MADALAAQGDEGRCSLR